MTTGDILGLDNELALAKVRIELERELRRIAYSRDIDIASRPFGVMGLARELVARHVLPSEWIESLKEVTSACNQAIHGREIPDEVAVLVVRVGSRLLEQLRLVRI